MMKSSDLQRAREIIDEIASIDNHRPVLRSEVSLVTISLYDSEMEPVREIDAEDTETIDAFVDLIAQRDASLPARRETLVAELAALGMEYNGVSEEIWSDD